MPEAISARLVHFPANGASTPGYLSRPRRLGPYPGIVVIQEWWGVEEHIKDVTRRFAREGYAALAPDLYHGKVAREPDEAMKLVREMDRDRAAKEVQGAIDYLQSRRYTSDKVGGIGYCLGGGLSFLAACQNRDLSACVVYYGSHPNPLDQVQTMTCPLLGIYAELDQRITGGVDELKQTLNRYGKRYDIHIYPNVQHAFFNDRNLAVYHAEAARDAWGKTLAFFKANLL